MPLTPKVELVDVRCDAEETSTKVFAQEQAKKWVTTYMQGILQSSLGT
jgi:hypothetical protein